LTDLLTYLARALAEHPDEVAVASFDEEDGTTVLELQVAEEDLGKMIGRRGSTVNALRTVIRAAATRQGGRVVVDIVD
jgi:predicted RNA-binding protein YlqC (UPF0109 family)